MSKDNISTRAHFNSQFEAIVFITLQVFFTMHKAKGSLKKINLSERKLQIFFMFCKSLKWMTGGQ